MASSLMRTVNFAGIVMIGTELLYAVWSGSGHTGIPLLPLSVPFILLLALAFARYLRARADSERLLASRGIIIGIFGAVLPPVLRASRVMMQYEAWIRSGMPEPPAWRIPLLIGYAAALSAALIAAGALSGRRNGD